MLSPSPAATSGKVNVVTFPGLQGAHQNLQAPLEVLLALPALRESIR
jgi:hypothetical protein